MLGKQLLIKRIYLFSAVPVPFLRSPQPALHLDRMEALAAGGEVGGARGAIFKQMAEMKKKIQLVEGERKAIFEDSEREKEENKDRIKKISDEIKHFKHEVGEDRKGYFLQDFLIFSVPVSEILEDGRDRAEKCAGEAAPGHARPEEHERGGRHTDLGLQGGGPQKETEQTEV